MRRRRFGNAWTRALVTGALVIAPFQQLLFAQPRPTSTRDGVYTQEQAQQGKAIYTKACAMCHGDALQGMGPNPPLKGDVFLDKWNGRTVADLFMKTITTMPATDPASLTKIQTAQVLSYILSENKLQPGKTELPTNFLALEAMYIHKP